MLGTVLIVEDEPALLEVVKAILRRAGYNPLTASDALEAILLSRTFTSDIHLLLTDVVMPGMDGFALAHQLLAERPEMRVLVMSAHTQKCTRLPFLRKPFHREQLLENVRSVIAGPAASPASVIVDDSAFADFQRAMRAAGGDSLQEQDG
jgi:DNA-binding response OmpR family regulator